MSSKGILLIVVGFEEPGSSAGAGVRHLIQKDLLFSPVRPGESFVWDRSVRGLQVFKCCINPLLPRGEPTANASIRCVQLADGTIVGDAAAATHLLGPLELSTEAGGT